MFLTDFLFLEIYRHGLGALSNKIKFIFQVPYFTTKSGPVLVRFALLRYRSVGGAVHGSESKDRWKRCWGEKMTRPPTLGLATL
jgi:hypothetical protein